MDRYPLSTIGPPSKRLLEIIDSDHPEGAVAEFDDIRREKHAERIANLETAIKTGTLVFRPPFGLPELDPQGLQDRNRVTVGILEVNKLKRLEPAKLQGTAPRLAALCADIQSHERLNDWIATRFGTIYTYLHGVSIWDVKMPTIESNSAEAMAEETKKHIDFLKLWYGPADGLQIASTVKYGKSHGVFPEHEEIAPFIDKPLLESSLLERAEKKRKLPDDAANVYHLRLEAPKQLPRKIRALLELYDLPEDTIKLPGPGQPKLAKQLQQKLGINPNNPVVSEFTDKLDGDYAIVISNDPMDILYSSTDKPWHSCACQKTGCGKESHENEYAFQKGPYADIAAGSSIAYLLDGAGKFVGRSLLRIGSPEQAESGGVTAVGIERYYGHPLFEKAFICALHAILKTHDIDTQASLDIVTDPVSIMLFPDVAQDIINPNKHHPAHSYRILRYAKEAGGILVRNLSTSS